jgi:hypothetical protein
MFRYRFLILVFLPVLLLAALLIGVTGTAQAQTTILYVDRNAGGSNNGSSWADAFTSLQGALTVANTNPANSYEVWVAKGAYTPGIARTDTFSLTHNNVQLYGGFAGTESQREDRNWGGNLTILSGDIDNNDAADANGIVANTANITGSNSYHVLWLDGVNNGPITGKTVIDGFFITAGQANGAPPDSSGGGIFCAGNGSGSECSPTLTNLIVIGNAAATGGGGIFNYGADGGISSPTLTGATIRNNSATAGGGLLNSGDNGGRSNPLLTQVFFVNNTAVAGGGIYNAGRLTDSVSSPILNNVTFQGNVASSNNGGGMYNNGLGGGQSSPSLTNVTFTGNSANAGSGGGMYNLGNSGVSNPSLLNVTFTSNTAVNGGGISNNGVVGGQSSPSLSNVTFTSNSATTAGGGMFSVGNGGASNPTLRNVRFVTNVATTVGGGLYSNSVNGGESNSTLIAVTFLGNSAANGGGMANVSTTGGNTSPSLTNVLVSGNLASALGGGILNAATAPGVVNPSLINATFSGNRAGNGAGMANIGSNPTIRNAIVWNNRQGNDVSSILNDSATPNVAHSLVEGCNPGGAWTGACGADGGNNLSDADPRFQTPVDPATAPTDAGTLRLEADSPAINVGNNAALPVGVTTDLDGNPRISNGTVDLGVYETLTASPLYVSQGATGANNGSSWADAFTYVQSALKVANNYPNTSYEIWVATGVYTPGSARDDSFLLRHNNVQLYGGFATTETLRTQRDWVANPTVLSGDNDGNDVADANGVVRNTANIVGSNSYHVVWLKGPITGTTVIDGFTITAGLADGEWSADNPRFSGAGLLCSGSGSQCSPTLSNLIFSANMASNSGGGLDVDGSGGGQSSPTLTNITFTNNRVSGQGGSGGGMNTSGGFGGMSQSSLTNVTFSGNQASLGAGMYNDGRQGVNSPSLTNVTFSDNKADSRGGGMYNNGSSGVSSPTVVDTIFRNNSATTSGGGMYNSGGDIASPPTLTNVTFIENSTLARDGGGMYNFGSSPRLTNVAFIGNLAGMNGGGMSNFGWENTTSSPTLINVLFSGNVAVNAGGGMYNDSSKPNEFQEAGVSSPILINVTFSGNWVDWAGGAGMYTNAQGGTSAPVLRNTIFWNNRWKNDLSSILNVAATPNIAHSLVQGCNPGGVWASACGADGSNNLADADPTFVTPIDATTNPTTTGNLRLQAGSPALNIGDNAALPAGVTTDLDGNPRIVNGVVDLGAYEASFTDTPIAGLSATSDSPTLLGQSTLFTATVNAGSNITYTWDFGDGAGTGSGATASYTFTATGTYTATVTASNGAGSQPAQTVVTVFALEPIYLPVVRR